MKKALEIFLYVERVLLSIPFIFLAFAIVANVIMRSFFLTGFSWLEEFSRYFFIIATFLGASIAISSDRHPRMTVLHTVVGPKVTRYFMLLGNVICLGITAYLLNYAVMQVQNLINMQTITSAMSVPLWTIYVVIPISMTTMTIRFVILIVKNICEIRADMLGKQAEEGNESC